jgi:hypothetical protein
VRIFECGTPPIPEEQLNDPLRDFQFVDGKKVGIDYYEENAFGSACMIGKTVRITCISEPPLPIVD